jgi:uncharacterized protein (DUF433 family)
MERHQLYKGRIISDPAVMLGKPVIAGTRITVELILELLSGGATVDDILNEYPHLKREDINAALAFAADAFQSDHGKKAVG